MTSFHFEPKQEPIPYTDRDDQYEQDDLEEDFDQDHDQN